MITPTNHYSQQINPCKAAKCPAERRHQPVLNLAQADLAHKSHDLCCEVNLRRALTGHGTAFSPPTVSSPQGVQTAVQTARSSCFILEVSCFLSPIVLRTVELSPEPSRIQGKRVRVTSSDRLSTPRFHHEDTRDAYSYMNHMTS